MSLYVYWVVAFILPKSVILEIEKLCHGYLWGSVDDKRMPALVAWDRVCLPKQNEGLGFKQLGLWNVASLGKQVWALAQKKDHLWVKWISSLYLKDAEFLTMQNKSTDIWHW